MNNDDDGINTSAVGVPSTASDKSLCFFRAICKEDNEARDGSGLDVSVVPAAIGTPTTGSNTPATNNSSSSPQAIVVNEDDIIKSKTATAADCWERSLMGKSRVWRMLLPWH